MQEEFNLLHPYEIAGDRKFQHWFLTESGACYTAYFVRSPGYFCNHPHFDHLVACFTFKPYQEGPSGSSGPRPTAGPFNHRIRDTVIWLLAECFRKDPENAIVVIYESCDRLAACRQRLFDRWFRNAGTLIAHHVSKYDTTFAGEGYGSIFITNHHLHHDAIRHAFTGISSQDK